MKYSAMIIGIEDKTINNEKTNTPMPFKSYKILQFENGVPTDKSKDIWVSVSNPKPQHQILTNMKVGTMLEVEMDWFGKVGVVKEVKR